MDKNKLAVNLFDHHSGDYNQKYFNVDLYEESLQFFISHLPEQATILDLGCGPGNVARYILDRFRTSNYLATDLSPKMLALAKANNPEAAVKLHDCRKLSEIEKNFNAIICSFCIPYLEFSEVNTLVEDINKSLDDNGLIYISFIAGAIEKTDYTTASSGMSLYMHYYPKAVIGRLLEQHFDIIFSQEITSYNNVDTDIVMVAKKKPH
jgi:SAM-dependent methyltransferase